MPSMLQSQAGGGRGGREWEKIETVHAAELHAARTNSRTVCDRKWDRLTYTLEVRIPKVILPTLITLSPPVLETTWALSCGLHREREREF